MLSKAWGKDAFSSEHIIDLMSFSFVQYSTVRVQSSFSLLKTILCFSYPKVNYLFLRERKSPGATEEEMEENTFPVLARK